MQAVPAVPLVGPSFSTVNVLTRRNAADAPANDGTAEVKIAVTITHQGPAIVQPCC